MAGLGSSLLSGVGQASTAAARPKPKKRKPAPAPKPITPRQLQRAVAQATQATQHIARPSQSAQASNAIAQTVRALGHATTFKPPKKHGGGLPLAALAVADRALSGKYTSGIESAAAGLASTAVGTVFRTSPIGLTLGAAGIGSGAQKLARNAGRDLIDIPASIVPSLYGVGKTAAEGHVGKALGSLAQSYVDLAEHPGKSIMNHPVGSLLLLDGLRGAGHAVGHVMRRAPSPRLNEIASIERTPRGVGGTRLKDYGTYSRDPLVKKVQKSLEARSAPKEMSSHAIGRQVDEVAYANDAMRRQNRDRLAHEGHVMLGGKDRTAAQVVYAQNIAQDAAGVQAYVDRLGQVAKGLRGSKLAANQEARAALTDSLKSHDPAAAVAAVRKFTQEINLPMQAKLEEHGLYDPRRQQFARLVPYATHNMGGKYRHETFVDRQTGKTLSAQARGALRSKLTADEFRARVLHRPAGIVDNTGRLLTIEDIQGHMKANGFHDEPAYVTNKTNPRGAKNFYVNQYEPPAPGQQVRTGAAIHQGTADFHPDVLVEDAVHTQGIIDQAEGYGRFIHHFAVVDPATSGPVQFHSFADATAAAREHGYHADGTPIKGVTKMRPVLMAPFRSRREQLQTLVDNATDENHPAMQMLHDAQIEALNNSGKGAGVWTLIPDAAANRIIAHIKKAPVSTAGRVANAYGSTFRKTVLATSAKWLTANLTEGGARAAVMRAGPASYRTAHGEIARLGQADPKAAALLREMTVGGGHFRGGSKVMIHTAPEHFADASPPVRFLVSAVGKFWRTRGPKELAGLWRAYTNFVFNTVNGPAETGIQTAMLGRAMKNRPLLTKELRDLSNRAVEGVVHGHPDMSVMIALGRLVDRAYGSYGKYPPGLKRSVATLTPFIPWAINATHFLYVHLPKNHPVLTSLIAASNQASEDWRRAHGLEVGAAGAVPGFLTGSIPTPGGGSLRVSRLGPPGLFVNDGAFGGLGGTIAGNVMPQVSGVLKNLEGLDWKGDKLPPGSSPGWEAIKSLINGGVPILAQGQRIAGNPGSPLDKLRKEFDPTWATSGKASGGVSDAPANPTGGASRTASTGGGFDLHGTARSNAPRAATRSQGFDLHAAARANGARPVAAAPRFDLHARARAGR